MAFLENIARTIKYTIQHMSRNGWQSLLVILVVAVTLLIAQLFAVVFLASNNLLGYFENQPQVTVFFTNDASEDQIVQIKEELEKDEQVKEVVFTSKEQAVEIYKAQNQENPELLEFVTPEILPASLEISTNAPEYLTVVADQFGNSPLVETVIFQKDIVDSLTRITNAVRLAGLVLLTVLLFNSASILLLVVANNIGAFRREIEIMRLVGAGAWYVRWPFLFDAVLIAVISSTVATLSMFFILPYINEFAALFLPVAELLPPSDVLISNLWVFTTGVGVLLTVVVSYIATWRYLSK